MLTIENTNLAINCHESGKGLTFFDKLRGMTWTLDYESMVDCAQRSWRIFTEQAIKVDLQV